MVDLTKDAKKAPTKSDLKRLVSLGALLAAATKEFEFYEAKTKAQKTIITRLSQEDIPQLMKEIGLTEIKLDTGESITVRSEISTSITEEKAPQCFAWLIEHGFGGLIKTAVLAEFSKDELAVAEKLAEQLTKKFGERVAFKQLVHPATLKSFVKERLEKGEKFPLSMFGVHQYDVAKMIQPKTRK